MGGIVFIALIFLSLVILVMRLLRPAATPKPKDDAPQTAHEAVISRLEDHRRRRQAGDDGDRE